MFTAKDVSHIIEVLDPVARTETDNGAYVLDRSGQSLVSLGASQTALIRHVEARGSILVKNLSSLLDVQDVGQILSWADQQPALATPTNGRLSLPPWMQKIIAVHIYWKANHAFTKLEDMVAFWGLPSEILQRIVDVYACSFYPLQSVTGSLCSVRLLNAEKKRLSSAITCSEEEASLTNLSLAPSHPSLEVLEHLLPSLVKDADLESFQLDRRPDGLYYIPTRAIHSRASTQLSRLLELYRTNLSSQGKCIITEPEPLHSQLLSSLTSSSSSEEELQVLERHPSTPASLWPAEGATVLLTKKNFDDIEALSLSGCPAVAKKLWSQGREVEDVLTRQGMSDEALVLCVNGFEKGDGDALYLRSTRRRPVEDGLRIEMSKLAERGAEALKGIVRLLPARADLYIAGLGVVEGVDRSLSDRMREFLVGYMKEDMVVHTGYEITWLDVRPPKTMVREWEKFAKETEEAKTIEELRKAIDRVRRKLKVQAIDAVKDRGDLVEVRDRDVQGMAGALPRRKRSSDILQHATWVLLACIAETPALFVSSGKVATRMIKAYTTIAGQVGSSAPDGTDAKEDTMNQSFDWIAAGRRLEQLRDRVKDRSEGQEDIDGVFELCKAAYEARRTR